MKRSVARKNHHINGGECGLTRCGDWIVGTGGDASLHIWNVREAREAFEAEGGDTRPRINQEWDPWEEVYSDEEEEEESLEEGCKEEKPDEEDQQRRLFWAGQEGRRVPGSVRRATLVAARSSTGMSQRRAAQPECTPRGCPLHPFSLRGIGRQGMWRRYPARTSW